MRKSIIILLLFLAGCFGSGYGLEAVIFAPGLETIEINQCETIKFKGLGNGGMPYSVNEFDNCAKYTYYWNSDDNPIDYHNDRTAYITFDTPGSFQITFTVTDAAQNQAADQIIVHVKPGQPCEDNTDADNPRENYNECPDKTTDSDYNNDYPCQGCCSYHGGIVCVDGVTQCADGTPLSDQCRQKGCSTCD